MCRNIRTLFNFEPSASTNEVHAASLQFVRKVSGYRSPSLANQIAFDRAVDDIAGVVQDLLDSLVTNAPARDREVEVEKARARTRKRYGNRQPDRT